MSNKNSLEKLFKAQLADIYYAEKQIVKSLPDMIEAASDPDLKKAFEDHLKESKEHVVRAERAFESIGLKARSETCEAIKGILEEAEEIADEFEDSDGIDAALICAAQKVEHYEIATYGSLVTWAKRLGFTDAAKLLGSTLDEEESADNKLSKLATSYANMEATAG